MYADLAELVTLLVQSLNAGHTATLEHQSFYGCWEASCAAFVEARSATGASVRAGARRTAGDRAIATLSLQCDGSPGCGKWTLLFIRHGGGEFPLYWRVIAVTRLPAASDTWLKGGPWMDVNVTGDAAGGDETARATVQRLFETCYRMALFEDAEARGEATATVTAGASGTATVELEGRLPKPVARCFERVAPTAVFPHTRSGPARISVRVHLRPEHHPPKR